MLLLIGLLGWSVFETAREMMDGSFPRSLGMVLLSVALLLQHPTTRGKFGRAGLIGAMLCIVFAFGVIFIAGRRPTDYGIASRYVGDPSEVAVQAAVSATERFHSALSERRYDDVCAVAERDAFSTLTELNCAEFLDYLHEKLGRFVQGSENPWYVKNDEAESQVAGETTSRYERAEAHESFDWRVGGVGSQAKLVQYHVSF